MKSQKPIQVSELLLNSKNSLKSLQDAAMAASRTLEEVRECLPEPLRAKVWSASLRGQTLTLLITSAAWGARLRYLNPPLCETAGVRLGRPVSKVVIRVRPAAGR